METVHHHIHVNALDGQHCHECQFVRGSVHHFDHVLLNRHSRRSGRKMFQNLCLADVARTAQMIPHVHKHELVAEHYFVGRMRVSADDTELNDVQIVELLQT